MSYDSDAESIRSGPVSTNTLLGYVDIEISEDEPIYANDSIIGSKPTPMDSKSPIPIELVKCKNCSKLMRLLIQCCAELPNTWYDRSLYVFICIDSKCRRHDGSVRVIRGIKKDKVIMAKKEKEEKDRIAKEKAKELAAIQKEEEKKKLTQNLFGVSDETSSSQSNPFGSNPFGKNPFDSNSSNLNNSFAALNPFDKKTVDNGNDETVKTETSKPTYSDIVKTNLPSKEKKEAQDIEEYTLPEFKGYILYFEPEVLDPSKQLLPPIPDNIKIQEEEISVEDTHSIKSGNLPKVNPTRETEDISKYFDDPTFQNFTNILSYNTQQVVRYEPDGSPILYSSKDSVSKIFYSSNGKIKDKSEWGIPRPLYNPGGSRRFEMQLMPKMIIDLENEEEDVVNIVRNGMEWGTIIVATDSDDFVPLNFYDGNGVAYLEEWCGVQYEDEVCR